MRERHSRHGSNEGTPCRLRRTSHCHRQRSSLISHLKRYDICKAQMLGVAQTHLSLLHKLLSLQAILVFKTRHPEDLSLEIALARKEVEIASTSSRRNLARIPSNDSLSSTDTSTTLTSVNSTIVSHHASRDEAERALSGTRHMRHPPSKPRAVAVRGVGALIT
jgi:hypothetical protein